MTPRTFTRASAAAAAFALVVAACGSDSSSDTATTGSATTEPSGGRASTEVGGTATSEAGATEGEIGAIVDGVAHGTAGFTIDTNECPDGWSNTQGVTDTEIKLGHSWIHSGAFAGYGATSDGMKAWFAAKSEDRPEDYGGRAVTLAVRDDGYATARTVTNVQELVEDDGIFAIPALAGTPNNLAVYDYINEQCVPHAAATGHPAWGDPVNHPWSTPTFLGYSTEGRIWAELILGRQDEGTLPNPTTVANLTVNNDFGLALLDSFKASVAESGGRIEIAADQLHDPAPLNLTNEITAMASSDADVVIVSTAGVACTQGMVGVAESAWEPQLKIIAAVCIGAGQFEPAGEAGDGWVLTGGTKDVRSPIFDDDPLVVEAREVFDAAGVDWERDANAGSALTYAIPTLEALKAANELPGGITRTNFVIAQRSLDFPHPYYVDGIRWHLDGLDDVYAIEASQLLESRFDAALGYAEPTEAVGEVIDVDGETPPCVWDGRSC